MDRKVTVYMITGKQYEELTGRKLKWKLKSTKPLCFLHDEYYQYRWDLIRNASTDKRFEPGGRPDHIRDYDFRNQKSQEELQEWFEKNAVNLSALGYLKSAQYIFYRPEDVENFIKRNNLFTPEENPDYVSEKAKDLAEGKDAFDNPVHVGDTVAFVVLNGYQKVPKGTVKRITPKSIVVEYNHYNYPRHYVAPWGYVIKYIDREKIYMEGYEDGYKDGCIDTSNFEYGRGEPTRQNCRY